MKSIKIVILFSMLTISCSSEQEISQEPTVPSITKAVALVQAIAESGVTGQVNFESTIEGVSVRATFSGLEEGKHGFHIHQYGDCTAPDGTSAGGHFNPASMEHSSPNSMNRHMGDMGNIIAGSDGKVELEYIDKTITIDQVLGRGIIIHAGEDDLTSQPSGAAGSRIACGVIGVQK